jgi:hypothetical protein
LICPFEFYASNQGLSCSQTTFDTAGIVPKTITDLPGHDPAPLHYIEQSSELQADWTAESKSDGANAPDGDGHLHP